MAHAHSRQSASDSIGNHVIDQIAIDHEDLRAGSYYWARRSSEDKAEVVQVSDVFGQERQYWSVAVVGSDQHHSLSEFTFLIKLIRP